LIGANSTNMIFVVQFSAIVTVALLAGILCGKRLKNRVRPNSRWAAIFLILLAVWFALTWWARAHAETDHIGWQLAETWAHTGKWYALLAGAIFAISFACSIERQTPSRLRRLLHATACLLFIGVVAWRTAPVYFLMKEGQRDSNGYLRQSKEFECTCGAVALANYLQSFRGYSPVSEREITKICRTTVEGSTTANILRAAEYFGLKNATARTITWNELLELHRPVIVSISTLPGVLHATLLVGMDGRKASFIDPAYGQWSISEQRFREIWRDKTILLD
jgi:hypothetical protein